MPEQAKLFFLNNQNLFSNNYLEHRLPEIDLWKTQRDNASAAFESIRKAYASVKVSKLGPGEEAELENKFIQPVLSALGFIYHVQPVTQRGAKKKRPDYALFKDTESYKTARKSKDDPAKFFSQSLTILEAKYWDRRLNDSDRKDVLDSRDPTAQTVKYLDSVNYNTNGRINWAILTNGRQWRLFYYRAASRSGNFFEVDLDEIITSGDTEKFLYFYLFFSRDAFIPDPVTEKTWLDLHLKGTEDYAARVSSKLKELIFDRVFEGLASGFVHYGRNELSIMAETEESRRDIYKGCLTILYRMLFILYAESRNLLPVEEGGYEKVSLLRLKKDIYNDLKTTGVGKMSKRSYAYWARLEGLFDIIAKGDPALNVPIYNGGLFDAPKGGFLSMHKIPDPFLADAIELLTVDHDDDTPLKSPLDKGGFRGVSFIDYSSLNVRHLGDIYEGILEFHIQIAENEIVEVREKGKSFWKKASEVKAGVKTFSRKTTGEVYIENSKHERKATGSYYTPHYIVEYIVKNTVGPVLEEKLYAALELLAQIEDMKKTKLKQKSTVGIQGYNIKIRELEDTLFNAMFDVKTLDPAMGSGHFLVHTVDFISDRIVAFLSDFPENPVIKKIEELRQQIIDEIKHQGVKIDEGKLTEVNLIKRMVMKKCIYGVDLNDMAVELAKLSLWLDSFTLGAPLSFLDHHLKCGNSLIGIFDISGVIAPGSEMYGKVQRALSFMLQVSGLTDATITEAKKSYELFSRGKENIEPIKRRFDASTAKYFMASGWIPQIEQLAYTLNFEGAYPEVVENCKKALRISKEKSFFHWKIEFPEVFYTEKGEKDNPGFDCVIGNPPYGLLSDKTYFKNIFTATSKNYDAYSTFIEQGQRLLKDNGLHSYIAPVSWQTGSLFESLRSGLLEKNKFISIINLPFDVFKDAYIDTGVFVLQKQLRGRAESSVAVYEFPKNSKIDSLNSFDYQTIHQHLWRRNEQKKIILNAKAVSLISKLSDADLPHLGTLTESVRGVLAKSEDITLSKIQGMQPFFDGEMFRYEMTSPDKFIRYGDNLIESPASFDFFTGQRVLVRRLVSRQDRLMANTVAETFVNKKDIYIFKSKAHLSPYYLLALLNSKLLSYIYLSSDVVAQKDDFRQTTLEGLRHLPIPNISFTTPEKERKERVAEAIVLYKNYMVELNKGNKDEKEENSKEHRGSLADGIDAGGAKETVSGKHSGTGKRLHGVRRRARKPQDAERVSEESEEYSSTTRYIESSLGIKSYTELAPYLAKGVERVMASLLTYNPSEVQITSEFICMLHKDAFGELFPDWAGRYRDRNVTVGKHNPPPYFEVPILIRQYCEDAESRLSSIGSSPSITEVLLEALAFTEGRLLSIHPFLDFNGRVARMLLFALLYRLNLPPVQLVPDETEKAVYLTALAEADIFNWQPLMEVWRKRFGGEK